MRPHKRGRRSCWYAAAGLLLLLGAPALAGTLEDAHQHLSLERIGRLLHDPHAQLSPEQVLTQMRTHSERDDVLRRNGRGYWLYAEVENRSAQSQWMISSSNHLYRRVQVWQADAHGLQQRPVSQLGNGRYGLDLLRHAQVEIPPGARVELLLLMQTRVFHPPQFRLHAEARARSLAQGYSAMVLLCIGAGLALLAYNLMLAVSLRSAVLASYCLYAVVHIVFMAYAAGLLGWLWPLAEHLPQRTPSAATVMSMLLFTYLFLRNGPPLPHVGKWLAALAVVLGVTGMMALLPNPKWVGWSAWPYLFCFFAGLVSVLGLSAVQVWRGYRPAIVFLLAWGILVASYAIAGVVLTVPELRTPWSNVLPLLGSSVEMTLLSLALAQQIAVLRKERAQAHLAQELAQVQVQRKAEFVATLSHEIRAPLVGLQASLRQLADKPQDSGEQLPAARASCEALNDLLDNMLDRAALAEGAAPPIQRFDPDRLMQAVAGVYLARAQEKGLQLRVQSSQIGELDGPASVLRRGLLNLVSNAVKYSERGTISIEAHKQADVLQLCVRDQGRGFTQPQMEQLQTRFAEDLDRVYSREPSSGLGLALTAELLGSVGGRLQVRTNETGIGSCVCIEVPLQISAAEASNDRPLCGRRFLVLDDSPVMRKQWQDVLEDDGAQVWLAESLGQARQLLSEQSIDGLICDQHLEDGRGVDWVRALRQNHDPARALLPVVLASAQLSEADRASAVQLGAWIVDPRALADGAWPEVRRHLLQIYRLGDELQARLKVVELRRLCEAGVLFLEQLAEDKQRLIEPGQAAAAAHRIASAAFGLGLSSLAEQAIAAEAELKRTPEQGATELRNEVRSAEAVVRSLLAR